MEKATTITLRVEKDLKQRFYELCDDFGMSASTAFNIFMKAVVRERKIPFEIQTPQQKKTQEYLALYESMRETVRKAGVPEMSLEEINAEIKSVRDAKRK